MARTTPLQLVAIRHAPTDWNRTRRLQGRTDVPLGIEGEKVARRWRPDPAWHDYRTLSSPLARAHETARLVFPEAEIEIDARLAEMDFGAWEGKSLTELRDQPGSDAKARERMGLDFHAPGGESPRQVRQRIEPVLQEIAVGGKPAILFTHKAVLRAMVSLATGWEMLGKPPVKLMADCAHLFSLAPDGALSIARMNVSLLPDVDLAVNRP